jgi:hypothetical protein
LKEEGRRKKEEGRRKKEEARPKKEEARFSSLGEKGNSYVLFFDCCAPASF